jgi:hypothetical protein
VHVGEPDRLAVERLEQERRRVLVAEGRDLERREQLVERVVRRGGREQREPEERQGERESTA